MKSTGDLNGGEDGFQETDDYLTDGLNIDIGMKTDGQLPGTSHRIRPKDLPPCLSWDGMWRDGFAAFDVPKSSF